jgi:hypothetical protein
MPLSKQDLPLEKQLSIQVFVNQVDRIPPEQVKEMCIFLYEQLHIQETIFKELIKSNWFSRDTQSESFLPF